MKTPDETRESLVIVARTVKTKGLKGELVADLLTDFPERFETTSELIGIRPADDPRVLRIESHSLQKDRLVLKFEGYDDIESAQALVGLDLAVPEAERVSLPADEFYDWELEGCQVRNIDGDVIGEVGSVLRTGGVELMVVLGDEKRETLIPLTESIVVEVDITEKRIVIDPPEGLLDL